MLDAGVDLRDVQIAARHADPRTTMRYDRARKNLDRHPNYVLAAYMASPPTWHRAPDQTQAMPSPQRPSGGPALPTSGCAHQGYAGDPQMPNSGHWLSA